MENVIAVPKKVTNPVKKAKLIYWLLTVPFVVTMLIAGVMLLARVGPNVEGITNLGYPVYVCAILGTAKLLAGIGIIQNRFHTLKEWAYAGYAFNLIGASASHVFSGDSIGKVITPAIILILVLASYWQWKNISEAKN
jgi:hypothetical protein